MKFGLKKLKSIMWCRIHFDILNRLGVAHGCNWRDG